MKHMKLVALLVAAMMVPPAVAESSGITKMEQRIEVGFHAAEFFAGCALVWQWKQRRCVSDDPSCKAHWRLIGIPLILDGARRLHHDLHKHIFTHMNAWYERKKQREVAQ